MRKVRHKNVVQFIGACTRKPNLCIVVEYMPGGSVYDYMRKVQLNISDASACYASSLSPCNAACVIEQFLMFHTEDSLVGEGSTGHMCRAL